MLFAQPKSASTFFSNVLAECLGVEQISYDDLLSGPNRFSIATAIERSDGNAVARIHAPYGVDVRILLNGTRTNPIVITRNLEDSIVSMTNHRLRRQSSTVDKLLVGLSYEDQLRITAYDWISWYAMFQDTWDSLKGYNNVLILDYEEIVNDPFKSTATALAFAGFKVPDERVQAAIEKISGDKKLSNRTTGAALRPTKLPEDVLEMIKTYGKVRYGKRFDRT